MGAAPVSARFACRVAGSIACVLLAASPSPTLPVTVPTNGMLLRTYGEQDGLPNESAAAVAQTSDGYLWIACGDKLVRFNGREFVDATEVFVPGTAPQHVTALSADLDGNLWAGSLGACYRCSGGRCEQILLPTESASEEVRAIAPTPEGVLRVLTTASVYVLENGRMNRYGDHLGMPYTVFHCALDRPDGSLWFGTNGGLLVATESLLVAHPPSPTFPLKAVVDMVEVDDGSVWLGGDHGVVAVDGAGSPIPRPVVADIPGSVRVLMRDRSGDMWVGTHGHGIYRIRRSGTSGAPVERYFEDAIITDLLDDAEGSMWAGTLGYGLLWVRRAGVNMLTAADGLPSCLVSSVCCDDHGTLWVGTLDGLAAMSGDGVRVFGPVDGLTTGLITGLYESLDGVLWVGTQDRWALRLSHGRFERGSPEVRAPSSCVVGICETVDGAVWIADRKCVLRFQRGERGAPWQSRALTRHEEATALSPTEATDVWLGTNERLLRVGRSRTVQIALPGEPDMSGITALCSDDEGGVWVGTASGALHYVYSTQAMRLEPRCSLPGAKIHEISMDGRGSVWFVTDAGIVRASVDEMYGVINRDTDLVRWAVVGPADGLGGTGVVKPSFSGSCWLSDGRMVFATSRGAAVMRQDWVSDEPGPRVVIEHVLVDDVPAPTGRRVFEPETRKFTFAFPALTFRDPARARYRYRLLGFQDEWVDAGDTPATTFLGIPAGSYTFEATASSAAGIWADNVARFSFSIKPHFYDTVWFRVSILLVAGALVVLAHRARMRRVGQREAELERLVKDRTEELEKVNARLEELSVTDPLTNIANLRRFKEMVDLEWRRSVRSASHMALVMVDIDWFKLYNDTYGHWAGDQALRNVARTLSQLVNRPGDLVARYGGEEFVVILAATDSDRARRLAEQMRIAVEALQIPHRSSHTGDHLTISLGVAATVPALGEAWQDLLESADRALYRAKQGGRNRVVA